MKYRFVHPRGHVIRGNAPDAVVAGIRRILGITLKENAS